MTNWMLRGLVFGAAMVVVRLFQGTLISVWQTDAASNPDPDRRGDLAMTWLLAGLVAGLVSGAVTWLISVFYTALYVGGLINELTTFAAFPALVVFLGAISGVAIGRWRVDRTGAYRPQSGARGGDEVRADTDVFAAVRSEQAAAEGAAWPQEQSASVATAEREDEAPTAYSQEAEETTEAVSPASEEKTKKIPWPPPSEEKTKKIPWPPPSAAKTEALPSHEHSEPATEHIEKPKSDDD